MSAEGKLSWCLSVNCAVGAHLSLEHPPPLKEVNTCLSNFFRWLDFEMIQPCVAYKKHFKGTAENKKKRIKRSRMQPENKKADVAIERKTSK